MTQAEQRAEEYGRGLYALRNEPSPISAFISGYTQAERDGVAAQSALAREVLAECRNATAGTLNDVTAKDLSDRLRVLFTRLGVKIGD